MVLGLYYNQSGLWNVDSNRKSIKSKTNFKFEFEYVNRNFLKNLKRKKFESIFCKKF